MLSPAAELYGRARRMYHCHSTAKIFESTQQSWAVCLLSSLERGETRMFFAIMRPGIILWYKNWRLVVWLSQKRGKKIARSIT